METINERIEELIKALGFNSLNKFDKALSVPRNTTLMYCGGKRSKPGPDFINKLLITFPLIDARWLMTGDGEIFSPEKQRKEYVESLEKRLEAVEREKRRYETMIDMAAQRNNSNFQPLSERMPVGKIIQFFANNLAKSA